MKVENSSSRKTEYIFLSLNTVTVVCVVIH